VRQGEWKGKRSGTMTRRMIRKMRTEGFTKKEIAKRLGIVKLSVKRKGQVTAKTEQRIERLFNQVMN
jgi:hypothetical protein